jgi:integrase
MGRRPHPCSPELRARRVRYAQSRRSTRSVPLALEVCGELDRLFKASTRQGDDDVAFGDAHTGESLKRAALMRRYRRALAAARLDTITRFYDLRHTFGTRMTAQGVAMRTLQEWMGHREIETNQRYADYAPSPHEAELVAAACAASTSRNATNTQGISV